MRKPASAAPMAARKPAPDIFNMSAEFDTPETVRARFKFSASGKANSMISYIAQYLSHESEVIMDIETLNSLRAKLNYSSR